MVCYDTMCRGITEVCAVDKVKRIYAKALAHYARQRDDIELEAWVSEIRLCACIRIGELSTNWKRPTMAAQAADRKSHQWEDRRLNLGRC
jgi:deoxyribodipyrimidine photolyase